MIAAVVIGIVLTTLLSVSEGVEFRKVTCISEFLADDSLADADHLVVAAGSSSRCQPIPLQALADKLKRLRVLEVRARQCPFSDLNMNAPLEQLRLLNSENYEGAKASQSAYPAKNLRMIRLNGLRSLTVDLLCCDRIAPNVDAMELREVNIRCHRLMLLASAQRKRQAYEAESGNFVQLLAPDLKRYRVDVVTPVRGEKVIQFASGLPQLEDFHLSFTHWSIGPRIRGYFFEQCPKLRNIHLSGIQQREGTAANKISQCEQMKHLRVERLELDFTSSGVIAVCPELFTCDDCKNQTVRIGHISPRTELKQLLPADSGVKQLTIQSVPIGESSFDGMSRLESLRISLPTKSDLTNELEVLYRRMRRGMQKLQLVFTECTPDLITSLERSFRGETRTEISLFCTLFITGRKDYCQITTSPTWLPVDTNLQMAFARLTQPGPECLDYSPYWKAALACKSLAPCISASALTYVISVLLTSFVNA